MKISLITVNYNSADHTIGLLKSLKEQTDRDFECLVIDNASQSEDIQKLSEAIRTESLPGRLIQSEKNTGFAGGSNFGIKQALQEGAECVFLINPDTTVKPNFISTIKAFISCRAGSIIALPIREGEKTAYAGIIQWFKETLPHQYDVITPSFFREKGYVIGAGMGIHASVFDQIGFLDERYFLYFEDADYSIRAQKAGIPIDIAPVAVYHAVSGSTRSLGSPRLLYYHYRNSLLFQVTHGPAYVRLLLPLWAAWVIVKQVIKIKIFQNNKEESKAILRGILDFWKGNFGKANY